MKREKGEKQTFSWRLTIIFDFSSDKLVEITKIQHVFGAQRAASMQAEFKDVRTGNKGQDKFRVSEEVEGAFFSLVTQVGGGNSEIGS